VELPQGQWPDLIEILLRFVNTGTSVPLRQSTLSAIGFICEVLVRPLFFLGATLIPIQYPSSNQDPDVLSVRADEILTAVVHGARKEEPSTDVQLAAMQALYNSLSFVRENFEREVCALIAAFSTQLGGLTDFPQGERNYIMQVVCEATQSPSVQVQATAFECLVRIMTLYYSKMAYYMERALFGVSHFTSPHLHPAYLLTNNA
jgi:importin subunit beta-1